MTRTDQRVVVVTGGGGGIGAAIAEELGREGAFVVTMDPLVSIDGAEQLPMPAETTAGRIVAAGGQARASSVSVTDRDGVHALFRDLVDELGRLDAVVNVAGISRPTSFASGSEDDWRSVLSVHLDGYRNVLEAALPIMAAAGRGRILGVTSGAGWRPANAGAYGCAKRAVASLTWQLGGASPPGVVVNAMSPIAVTRMVTAALERAPRPGGSGGSGAGSSASGGLSLGSMPAPEQLGPVGAHLVGEELGWCTGQVVFVGGSEVALIDPPRLLEVVRTEGAASLAHVLEAVTPGALGPAEAGQVSSGGSNPRFGPIYDGPGAAELPAAEIGSCVVFSDRPDVAAVVHAALSARAVPCHVVDVGEEAQTFGGAAAAMGAAVERVGPVDAVVVALAGSAPVASGASAWERVLADHADIVGRIHADAGWARATADHAAGADRRMRLVTLTDATTPGGRTRAQAAAQLARAASGATDGRVAAFAVALEAAAAASSGAAGELAAHLLCSPVSPALSGAELVAGDGWVGLRSHPRPGGSITYGGPTLPAWFDATLASMAGREGSAG